MKIDYNKLMHQQIDSLSDTPKFVLHVCCAPCSSAVIGRLNKHFDITYYYYNPNIYPESEFYKRKEEFKKLGVQVVDNGYDHKSYLSEVAGLE